MKANNGPASYSSGRTPDSRRLKLSLTMLAAGILVVPTRAEEPVPGIIDLSYAANNLQLTLSNLGTGGTYDVESTGSLGSNDWVEIDFFEGLNGSTHWSETLSGFGYRGVLSDSESDLSSQGWSKCHFRSTYGSLG